MYCDIFEAALNLIKACVLQLGLSVIFATPFILFPWTFTAALHPPICCLNVDVKYKNWCVLLGYYVIPLLFVLFYIFCFYAFCHLHYSLVKFYFIDAMLILRD